MLESLSLLKTSGIHWGVTFIHYIDCILEWCLLAYETPIFYSHTNFPFRFVYTLGARVNWKTMT